MEILTKEFITQIRDLYVAKKHDDILAALQNKCNVEVVLNGGLEIVAEIGNLLNMANEKFPSSSVTFAQHAFNILATNGNAKELLMGFLEQMEILKSTDKFFILLHPIQVILLRMPTKRGQSLLYVLEMLHDNIKRLKLPKFYGFEEKERLLFDLDPDVIQLVNSLEPVISFYEPFVKEVSRFSLQRTPYSDRLSYQQHVLSVFLLKLFDKPLTFVDLSNKDSSALSGMRTVVEKLIEYLYQLESNFYAFVNVAKSLNHKKLQTLNINCTLSQISLGTLHYVLYSVGKFSSLLPCVYNERYLFDLNLPLVSSLLKQRNECAIHKGLILFGYVLNLIKDHYFCDDILELDNYVIMAQDLTTLMMNCTITEFRKIAVKSFKNYIDKFTSLGRYKLLLQLVHVNKHPGIRGLIIQCYKDCLVTALQKCPPIQWFVGGHLKRFLNVALVLNDGVKTDLLEEHEYVLSALNFLRFLLLRDDLLRNITGIWANVESIESLFLNPLQLAINMSKAHFELELRNMKDKQGSGEYNVNKCQQLSILQSGITGIDLIQSVLSVVNDIISNRRQQIALMNSR